MTSELAYAIVTPYTIRKSRTGAVLARLLGSTSAQLIAARLVSLTRENADEYAESIVSTPDPDANKLREVIREYIRESIGPDKDGGRRRALLLVFKGENARREISDVAGSLTISCDSGDTIRNAYGDLVWNDDGSVRFFEPAILISDISHDPQQEMSMWLKFLKDQSPLMEGFCSYNNPEKVQQTLVLIKPDCWRQRSGRAGNILDMFSRTGLRIIGCKLCFLSTAQAVEFYKPVKDALRKKLAPGIGEKAKETLEHKFNFTLPDSAAKELTDDVGIPYADEQFEKIVEFMSGRRPSQCPPEKYEAPGLVPTLGLVYEGEQAVNKIRDVLGPTDPTQAPAGTVRREFGSDVMVNTAHASDSPENAQREMDIIDMRQSNCETNIKKELKECTQNDT